MLRKTLVLLGGLLLTSTVFAVVAPQANGAAKYGVIDMQAVILNVSEGKEARATLEKEIQEKEKERQKEREALDKMNEEWKSQAAVLSEAARLKKQQEFQEKFIAFRNAEQKFDADIKRKEQKATQAIAIKVARIVEDMAKQKQLEAVFETNTAGLLYLKDPVDLTKDVIAAYEKASGSKPVAKKDGK
jgi:outer membrane protein